MFYFFFLLVIRYEDVFNKRIITIDSTHALNMAHIDLLDHIHITPIVILIT